MLKRAAVLLKQLKVQRVLMIGIALALRCIALQSRGIWYDDAFSIFLARQSLARIVQGTAVDTMPPLYYFLLHFWMRLGDAVWLIRTLNVLLGVAIVWVIYLWIFDLYGHPAGFWAGMVAAGSPLLIYHAQEVRMYSILTLSLSVYAWCFTRIYRRVQPGRMAGTWIGMTVSGALAMYSHNLAVFTLVAPVVFLALKRAWGLLGRQTLALAVTAILALPWLLVIPGQIQKIQTAFWTPRPGMTEVLQALVIFHTNLPLPRATLPAGVFLSIFCLVLVIFELARNRWKDDGALLLGIFALLPPTGLFVASYLMRPVFVSRSFMLSGAAYFGLAGLVIAQGRNRIGGWLIAGLFAVSAVVGLSYQYTFVEFPRSPYRAAMVHLEKIVQPGDVIVHDNKLSYFPSHYYAPELQQVFLADEPGSHNDTFALESQQAMGIFPKTDIQSAVGGADRVYFVVYTKAIEEYRSMGKPDHPVLSWLDQHYTRAEITPFNDLLIYRYEKKGLP